MAVPICVASILSDSILTIVLETFTMSQEMKTKMFISSIPPLPHISCRSNVKLSTYYTRGYREDQSSIPLKGLKFNENEHGAPPHGMKSAQQAVRVHFVSGNCM